MNRTESVQRLYRPLQDGDFRVLHIESGDTYPVRCRLEHRPYRLEGEFNPYMTLSYAWGETFQDDSHLNEQIICGGVTLRVTTNLERALRSIRRKLASRELVRDLYADPGTGERPPLWVDAVCINQHDTAERNSQIQQMAEIYSNSSRLIIWLGEPGVGFPPNTSASMVLGSSWQSAPASAYTDLARAAWFQRRWVVQEFGLTPDHFRFVLFGDTLSDADVITRRLGPTMKRLGVGLSPIHYGPICNPSQSLLYNLQFFDSAQCSRPHDLIYALLSLSRASGEADGVTVDYTQSVESLFLQVAHSILRADPDPRTMRLPALLAVATAKKLSLRPRSRPGDRPGLPSWVPDWREPSSWSCEEHHCALESLCRVIGSASAAGDPVWRRQQPQWTRWGGPRVHFAIEEGAGLLHLGGRLLSPCFPPAHRATGRLYVDPRVVGDGRVSVDAGEVRCWTCEIFDPVWDWFSDEAKEMLGRGKREGCSLFMLPHTRVVFVLRPRWVYDSGIGAEVRRFEVVSCVAPDCHLRAVHDASSMPCAPLEDWLMLFAVKDVVSIE